VEKKSVGLLNNHRTKTTQDTQENVPLAVVVVVVVAEVARTSRTTTKTKKTTVLCVLNYTSTKKERFSNEERSSPLKNSSTLIELIQ
jgi:hypothetical protein